MNTCKEEGCERGVEARGWCSMHYQRWKRDPDHVSSRLPMGRTSEELTGSGNPNWRGGKSKHPLYLIYHDMKSRCYRKTHPRYADYGGRGISVHPSWVDDFWQFVEDVGERPEGKTKAGRAFWQLDRIDNDGNYEPGNVRWATPDQQAENRRPEAYSGVLRGSKQKTSKLTENDVLDIVSRIPELGDGGQTRLAEEYGVSKSLINNIWRGRTWNWLTRRAS